MPLLSRGVTAATLAALPALATSAELVVLVDDGSPATPSQATITFNPDTGGWNIILSALYAPAGETIYNIRGDGGEIIDNIIIDVPCWEGPSGECVPAGSPLLIKVLSDPPLGIDTIHNIVQTGDAETLLLDVQAERDIGLIEAEVIGTVVAGRDIHGPIISTTPDHTHRGIFWVEAQRDLLGDVRTPNGRIGRVWAYRHMGAPGKPITIEAKHRLNGCIAFGEMHANVNTRVNGGAGNIYNFYAGTFDGVIETEALRPDWATGTPGQMVITDSFTGTIIFGKSFDHPEQYLQVPTHGLSGAVVINADDEPNGVWSSPIKIGPDGDPEQIILDGPDFDVPLNLIGGGAVGVVPYGLHLPSCEPAHGASVEPGMADPLEVVLRHYGPVAVSGGEPVIIERRPAGSPGAFEPVSLDGFAIQVGAESNALHVAELVPAAGFVPDHEYRLTATAGLLCDVPDPPAVEWETSYSFTVLAAPEECAGDIDGSGSVDLLDLLALLIAWGPAPGSPADLNGDGVVSIADLLMLLTAWGPCG